MATHRIVFLFAEMTSRAEFRSRMTAVEHILTARGLMDYTRKVDGSAEQNKSLRNAMFRTSGRRGDYPQVFLQPLDADPEFGEGLEFVGGYHEIQALNENEDKHSALSAVVSRATGSGATTTLDVAALMEAAAKGDKAAMQAAVLQSRLDGGGDDAEEKQEDAPVEEEQQQQEQEQEQASAEPIEDISSSSASDEAVEEESNGDSAAASAEGWEELQTDEGESYFHNTVTGETRWTKPAEMGGSDWQRFLTDEGQPYWYNRVTEETTWDEPASD